MSSPRPVVRLSPPEWLLSGLRPKEAPIPWAAVGRAGVAITVPFALGLGLGRPSYGAIAAIGALSGVIIDTADAYRMRVLNIAIPQLFGAVGVTLGALVHGRGWIAVAMLTFVALVSGMISSIGAVASLSGLLLLLNAVIGAGLALPDPWWVPPLLLGCGGLFVLVLGLLGWPFRGRAAERTAVADAYRASAELLAAAGRTDADYDAKRQAVTAALNQAYDLVLARRARDHGRRSSLVRLLSQLNVLTPLVEAAPAAHLRRRPLPDAVPEAVRALAGAVDRANSHATGHATGQATGQAGGQVSGQDPAGAEVLDLPPPETPSERAVDAAVRHASLVVRKADPDPYNVDDRLGGPAALRVRIWRTTRNVLFTESSWRYGLRLALCIGLAQALVSVIDVPRSYWVALTVTFVLKPDFGSVFSRGVLRALGTVAGLVVAAAVLSQVPRGWWDVPVLVVLAALIPAASAKSYGLQTAAVTPVILLLSDVLNRGGFNLVVPRLVDSLLGCAIALIAGYLLWPESWHTRIGDRLADAVDDAAEYVASAFGAAAGRTEAEADEKSHQAERVRRRRVIYRDLSVVRTEFQRALTEPPPTGRRAAAWWPLVIALERIIDATTAARVRVNHGAVPPEAAEIADAERQLRELAARVRSSVVLVKVRDESAWDEEGVLAPLRQELHAAQAITSPRR